MCSGVARLDKRWSSETLISVLRKANHRHLFYNPRNGFMNRSRRKHNEFAFIVLGMLFFLVATNNFPLWVWDPLAASESLSKHVGVDTSSAGREKKREQMSRAWSPRAAGHKPPIRKIIETHHPPRYFLHQPQSSRTHQQQPWRPFNSMLASPEPPASRRSVVP
jgi:hypothetical protein